uniref:Uncharacterized protein n=1 Tax=Grammatophora oceanica TaxID=210454 RepID=A0A7S1UUX0_9STRA|mmetsp:Transcript_21507/g.32023  ORF Transcript_21507/g.32023 Transcript_21507/m.32023 type:complete len:181 (+) Transcript_21507:1306-1848(+)
MNLSQQLKLPWANRNFVVLVRMKSRTPTTSGVQEADLSIHGSESGRGQRCCYTRTIRRSDTISTATTIMDAAISSGSDHSFCDPSRSNQLLWACKTVVETKRGGTNHWTGLHLRTKRAVVTLTSQPFEFASELRSSKQVEESKQATEDEIGTSRTPTRGHSTNLHWIRWTGATRQQRQWP